MSDKDKIVSEERNAIPNTKVEKLINQLRPQSQLFQINSDSDNLISCKNGTMVFVPKWSFVDVKGETIHGKVDIEFIEVLSASDIIKTNLQTVSNGRPLQSEGMIYIDAKLDGKQINLAANKKLQIELPKIDQSQKASDIRIFTGAYDELGNINWNEADRMSNKLIPLPLDVFSYIFKKSFRFKRESTDLGYSLTPDNDKTAELDSTFRRKDLENTFVTTREFEQRASNLWLAEWVIGHYNSIYSTTVTNGIMLKDYEITKIYLNNLNKDLCYCDSLAYTYFKSWKENSNISDSWYFSRETKEILDEFESFYKQRLTSVIRFPTDIDLNTMEAREKLISKGYKDQEIDELLGANERRNRIIAFRRNKQKAQTITSNSFQVAKLGWINCDQFYNDPVAKEVKILAGINNNENEFACVTLILNGRGIALNGILNGDSKYSFTGKSAPYTKLPIGEKASIIGISYKDEKPYFGIQEIVISEQETYDIVLKVSSIEEINEKLKAIH